MEKSLPLESMDDQRENNCSKLESMDDQRENDSSKEERKIPVLTVIKNSAILKNIFVVNNPISEVESPVSETEETVLVGRHPDCNIVLTHPSISRFHLQIHTKPSSHKLYVTDLSSVHGTWVSGKKMEAGNRVELKEGDTIRVGGSSRIYRLRWVPLGEAYVFESHCPVILASEGAMLEGKENGNEMVSYQDERLFPVESEPGDLVKDENCSSSSSQENTQTEGIHGSYEAKKSLAEQEKTIQSHDANPEGATSFFTNENSVVNVEKEIQASSVSESTTSLPVEEGGLGSLGCGHAGTTALNFSAAVDGFMSEKENQPFGKDTKTRQPLAGIPTVSKREEPISERICSLPDEENDRGFANDYEEGGWECLQFGYSISKWVNSLLPVGVTLENEDQQFDTDKGSQQNHLVTNVCLEVTSLERNLSITGAFDLSSSAEATEPHVDLIPSTRKEVQSTVQATENTTDSLKAYIPEEENEIIESKEQLAEGENKVPGDLLGCRSISKGGIIENNPKKTKVDLLLNLDSVLAAEDAEGMKHNGSLNVECVQGDNSSPLPSHLAAESLGSSSQFAEFHMRITDEKFSDENKTPQGQCSLGLSQKQNLESLSVELEKSRSCSIWSRRGKSAGILQVQTGRHRRNSSGAGIDAKHKTKPQENTEVNLISKLCSPRIHAEEGGQEIFTPDKENMTPNTLLLKSMKKIDGVGDSENSTPFILTSPSANASQNIHLQEDQCDPSDKENQMPLKVEQTSVKRNHKKRTGLKNETLAAKERAERAPFQSLFENTESVVPSTASHGKNSVNFRHSIRENNKSVKDDARRSWIMVVDAASLLDKESRKAIQLLRGIKGTQLIIPRMVLKELDCLKQHGFLFKRTEVPTVLQWIKDCMVTTNWWIQVQSEEEARLVAATPPATPQSMYGEGNRDFLPNTSMLSPHGSLMQVVSPTPDDHVLDCAMHYRKMKNNARLVIISNDVTLKIKAMEEGLLCETAEEFRESLVNPFSERFLWVDSSPRGLTWSCADDVVLRDKYYSRCAKVLKGEAKGLKLILLHNSHYRRI